MKRVKPEVRTARVNVIETLKTIEKDIVENQSEVISRKEYYSTKYRGDILNDINVGIIVNDNLETVIQVYVSNGFTSIRKQFVMNKGDRSISHSSTVTSDVISFKRSIEVYDGRDLNDKVNEILAQFKEDYPHYTLVEKLIHYPVDLKHYELELQVI